MKKLLLASSVLAFALSSHAQILLSGGLTYSQNFDSLANSPAAGSATWTDNVTLPGWFASRAYTSGTSSTYGPYAYTAYRIGDGSANNGSVWSLGVIGDTDRALGSIASGTPKTNAFGLLIQNDTGAAVNNILISYTGEQWRNGGNTTAQTLGFSYKISTTPLGSPLDVVLPGVDGWVGFSALDFVSPVTGSTASALDGNQAANQTAFSNVLLTGVTLNPGEELFLRWLDPDDSGNDHGFGVDNFSFSASTAVPEPTSAALLGIGTLAMLIRRRNRR